MLGSMYRSLAIGAVVALKTTQCASTDGKYYNAFRAKDDGKANIKTIHFVRHAQGYHNVAGAKNPVEYLREDLEDAKLTEQGVEQCNHLKDISGDAVKSAQLLVVSPLNRTMQTATYSFPQLVNKIPWVAVECLREQTGLHPCDRRRPLSEHQKSYQHIRFHEINNETDPLYYQYKLREPHADVEKRAREFMLWLKNRPESEIIVVSHKGYLSNLFHTMIKTGEAEDTLCFKNCELRTFIIDFS